MILNFATSQTLPKCKPINNTQHIAYAYLSNISVCESPLRGNTKPVKNRKYKNITNMIIQCVHTSQQACVIVTTVKLCRIE